MKRNTLLSCCWWIMIFCLCVTHSGCGLPRKRLTPLQGGYWGAQYYWGYPDESSRTELQYEQHSGKKTVVWPVLIEGQFNDSTVLFTGTIHQSDGRRRLGLFVFAPPGPPVNIRQRVLELKALQLGKSLSEMPKSATIETLRKVEECVEIRLASTDWADTLKLSWLQISALMREGKAKAIERKDGVYGTMYLDDAP